MSTTEDRFMALWQVIHYIREGPYEVLERNSSEQDEAWLEPILQMSQFIYKEGMYELRSLYFQPHATETVAIRHVVRRVIWDRIADRKRCEEGVVRWPDMQLTHHSGSVSHVRELGTALKRFDAALGEYPFEVIGLDLTEERETMPARPLAAIQGRPPHRRWLERRLSASNVELVASEGNVPEFDRHWNDVWDALGQICDQGDRLEDCREEYWVAPEKFAELITSGLS